jgi:hypothetical protein
VEIFQRRPDSPGERNQGGEMIGRIFMFLLRCLIVAIVEIICAIAWVTFWPDAFDDIDWQGWKYFIINGR